MAVLLAIFLSAWPRAVRLASGPALLGIGVSLLGGFTLARRQLN